MTGEDKNAYNSPMKAYRFKCWAFNCYIDHVVNAQSDQDAQQLMVADLQNNKVKIVGDCDFRPSHKVFITFEEINNELTKISSKETKVGTSVGRTSTEPKESNS